MVDLSTRVATGPRKNLSAGDIVHQFVVMVGVVYGPLISCYSSNLDETDSDPVSFELMRHCPHAKDAAAALLSTCQFAPCHCNNLYCDINQMYGKLVSATYAFVRQYARVTGLRYAVTKASFRILFSYLGLQSIVYLGFTSSLR